MSGTVRWLVVPRVRRARPRPRPIRERPSLLYSTLTLTYQRVGDVTRVLATSALTGTVFFVWYLDGAYVGTTTTGQRDFQLGTGSQARIDVVATTDPAFDAIANAPAGFPPVRSLWWVRSASADVDHYLIEQKENSGSFVAVAQVAQTLEGWDLGWTSDRLDDLSSYTWRITPYDAAGNAGTAKTFGPEKIVRRPDAPNFTVAASGGLVTFTGAS